MKKIFILLSSLFLLMGNRDALLAQAPAKPKDGPVNNMYRGAIDMWVQRLENRERDAYQKPDDVVNFLGNIKGKTVYDLGAGTGYFSVRFAKKGAHVIAAEVEQGFLNYIRNRLVIEHLDSGRVELRKIPFENPGIKPNEADFFFIANTYHHLSNKVAYLKLIKKGLKKHGEVVIIAFFKRNGIPFGPPMEAKQTETEIQNELTQAGFENIQINTTLLPYQFIIRAKVK